MLHNEDDSKPLCPVMNRPIAEFTMHDNDPISIQLLRKFLRETGLTNEETDKFLNILATDWRRFDSLSEESLRVICDEFVSTLKETSETSKTNKSKRIFATVSAGLALGVVGNLLTDLLKSGYGAWQDDEIEPIVGVKVHNEDKPIGEWVGVRTYRIEGLRNLRVKLGLSIPSLGQEAGFSPELMEEVENSGQLRKASMQALIYYLKEKEKTLRIDIASEVSVWRVS